MIENFLWSFGERIIAQIVTLFVSIVLARILLPSEFGVVSLVLIFITLANVIVSDGFGTALIQKDDSDDIDFSSVFWFSEFLAIVVYSILFFLAPFIAEYYHMQILQPVLRVLGLRLPLAAINSIQKAKVSKELKFRKFFFSTIIGTVVSGFVGILMALRGYGVWSIVFQYLTNCLVDTMVLFFTCNWRPRFLFSFSRLKPLVSFGWKILFVSLMNSLYSNLRNLIIGKKYSADELAFNKKAESFPSLISTNINSAIVSVLFPLLVKQKDSKTDLLHLIRRFIGLCLFILTPVLLGLAAVSKEVVIIVLTDKWLPCVPYMKILCIVFLFQPIQHASIQTMKALGKGGLYLELELVKKIIGLIILISSLVFFDSVLIIVVGALVAEVCSTVINFPVNKKLFGYSYKNQLLDIIVPIFGALLMWWVVSFSRPYVEGITTSLYVILVFNVFIGAAVYLLYSLLFNKSVFFSGISLFKSFFLSLKKSK